MVVGNYRYHEEGPRGEDFPLVGSAVVHSYIVGIPTGTGGGPFHGDAACVRRRHPTRPRKGSGGAGAATTRHQKSSRRKGSRRGRLATMSEPTCALPALLHEPTAPPSPTRAGGQVLLAILVATRPPDEQLGALSSSFVASLALNAPGLAREAPLLIFANDAAEASGLAHMADAHKYKWPSQAPAPRVMHFEGAVSAELRKLNGTIHRVPELLACIAPHPFAQVSDIVRYSSIWRSIKRMYGVRSAMYELGAQHVLATDADGYVWKPIAASAIVAHSRTAWFSDHRGERPAADTRPRPDTNARSRSFCSLHPWAAALRSTSWDEHGARWAIGRDWAAWEDATTELMLMPAPDADLADDPLLVLDRGPFMALWAQIETYWRAPLFTAMMRALTSPAALYKHCVRGDVLFLELSYRAFVYHLQQSSRPRQQPPPRPRRWQRTLAEDHRVSAAGRIESVVQLGASTSSKALHFRNSTAVIEAVLPSAARPLGFPQPSMLPLGMDGRWYHASPSGWSRLWLHLQDGASARAIRALHQAGRRAASEAHGSNGIDAPFVAFRYHGFLKSVVDDGNNNLSSHACRVAHTVMQLDSPAASIQLSSAPMSAARWAECVHLLPSSPLADYARTRAVLDSDAPPPRYWRHAHEWVPEY